MEPGLYRGYDKAALDRQYNNLLKVPAERLEAYRSRWARENAAAKADIAHVLDLPYGPSNLESLDLFMPSGSGSWPVMVYIHGGYWRGGDKAECAYIAQGFCREDILTVIINYGLLPATRVREQVSHCASALHWVCENIDRYGGDPDRVFITGHSAGAHLAAMLIATPAVAPALPADAIKGICAISGVYDLEPVRLSYVNETLHLSDRDVAELSPVHCDHDAGVSLLFAVGALEGDEFIRQTHEIAARWSRGSDRVEMLVAEKDNHFSIRTGWSEPKNIIHDRILALMARSESAPSFGGAARGVEVTGG